MPNTASFAAVAPPAPSRATRVQRAAHGGADEEAVHPVIENENATNDDVHTSRTLRVWALFIGFSTVSLIFAGALTVFLQVALAIVTPAVVKGGNTSGATVVLGLLGAIVVVLECATLMAAIIASATTALLFQGRDAVRGALSDERTNAKFLTPYDDEGEDTKRTHCDPFATGVGWSCMCSRTCTKTTVRFAIVMCFLWWAFVVAGVFTTFAFAPVLAAIALVSLLAVVGRPCRRLPIVKDGYFTVTFRVLLAAVITIFLQYAGSFSPTVSGSELPTVVTGMDPQPLYTGKYDSYAGCEMRVNGVALLDQCLLAAAVYDVDPVTSGDVVRTWFGAAGTNMTEVSNVVVPGVGLRYMVWRDADAARTYVAVRGTTDGGGYNNREWLEDAYTWADAAVLQIVSALSPMTAVPMYLKQYIVDVLGKVGTAINTDRSKSYYGSLNAIVADLIEEYPNDTISITGHSLGGGLASIVGETNGVPSVSFSGPGTVLSARKIGLLREPLLTPGDDTYLTVAGGWNVVIMPDNDIVPEIDVHAGVVQRIRCLGTADPWNCHSLIRACCELRNACGDAYGRGITSTASSLVGVCTV